MDTLPINKETLKLFTGRENETKILHKLLNIYNIAIIEGDYGIGKTSLGNYYRFNKERFVTPIDEISTDVRWNTKDFLHEILKGLVEFCVQEKLFQYTDHMKRLVIRYGNLISKDLDINIMGNGLSYREKIESSEIQTQSGLIYDLKELSKIAVKNDKEIIIQLNNLDLSLTDKKDIIYFFSQNRNIFQIPNVKWILTGSIGLSDLFTTELKKFSSIIGKPLYLSNMDYNSVSKLIDKRYKIAEELKKKLVEDKENLRDIINILNIFKKEKLSSKKMIKDYFDLFDFDEYEMEVLICLKEKSMSINDISKVIGKSYKAVNKRVKSLVLKQAVRAERGACYIQFEAYCSLL
jgi:hypothetical protein